MIEAVFLDKDGTLLDDVPYNVDPRKVRFCPGVADGISLLAQAGYRFVVVSNQEGLGLGYFSRQDLQQIQQLLEDFFVNLQAPLLGCYFCPHPTQWRGAFRFYGCTCRKPQAGLFEQAAREHGIACGRSWMIGDILNDVEAAHWAGCKAVLLDKGHETEWNLHYPRFPDMVCQSFLQAATEICVVRGLHRGDAPTPAALAGHDEG